MKFNQVGGDQTIIQRKNSTLNEVEVKAEELMEIFDLV
jgi:hypothetical protein